MNQCLLRSTTAGSGALLTLLPACMLVVVATAVMSCHYAEAGPVPSPAARWGSRDTITCVAKALTEGAEPSLSPDGHSLAFTRNGTSIWILDIGTSKIRLLRRCGNAHSPIWDPTGTRIAFSGNPGSWDPSHDFAVLKNPGILDSYGIWIINSDGSNLHKLPDGSAYDQYPLWSSDGEWIAWTRDRQQWISDTTGARRQPLTASSARQFDLVSGFAQGAQCSPDGSCLYQSLWAVTAGFTITERREGGKSWTVLITRGNGSVGRLAIAKDQSFVVYDDAEPEDDELISIVRLP